MKAIIGGIEVAIPEKQIVLESISTKYNCILSKIGNKKIMYEGISSGKKLVLCTPQSTLHPPGKGWFDLTLKQVEILDDSDITILSIRLAGHKVYNIDFKELRQLMTPEIMIYNPREGEHWKLYVWPNYVKIQGNEQTFPAQPVQL